MKRYMRSALAYAVAAMVGGVFYRELTRYLGFTSQTTLAFVHTHYFMLGMVLFLLLVPLERSFAFTCAATGRVLCAYHAGLNLTAAMLVARGLTQVLRTDLPAGMSAAISGLAGVGHTLLGVSLVLILLQVRSAVVRAER
ncbi:DUF2871 domain-containing protein [Olsenella sp. HMSC062G07]|uniref:DUF2871 domain-containing protein n=1 Tax=Olsenella sp. HMSC062G07 TaxID=1739330 RepID=UPI0008A1A32F|nr:DUF2871 domain-containing protein [Olsenella sp. HMSC062G07]OFK22701.1 hypothetical protein HMPREF2826_01160 [Olsenella sp. HMSC062G07]